MRNAADLHQRLWWPYSNVACPSFAAVLGVVTMLAHTHTTTHTHTGLWSGLRVSARAWVKKPLPESAISSTAAHHHTAVDACLIARTIGERFTDVQAEETAK
jgi:hypothetical protein